MSNVHLQDALMAITFFDMSSERRRFSLTPSSEKKCKMHLYRCRFIAVTRPVQYAKHKSNNRVILTIAIVWIISVTIGLPIVLGLNTSPERTPELCIFYNSDFIIYSSLGSFYIPCVLMVFLYYRIFKAIHERAKRQIGSSSVIVNSHASKSGNNVNNKIVNVTTAAATPTTNTSSSNNTEGKKSSHSSLSTGRAQVTISEAHLTTTGATFSPDVCDTCNDEKGKQATDVTPFDADDDKSTQSASHSTAPVTPLASRKVNNNANRKPTGITHVEIVSDQVLPNDAIVIENVITKSVMSEASSFHETESTEMTVMSFPQLPVKSGRFGSRKNKFSSRDTPTQEDTVHSHTHHQQEQQLNSKSDCLVQSHKTNDSESNLHIEMTNKDDQSSCNCEMTGSHSQIIENKGARYPSHLVDSESLECACDTRAREKRHSVTSSTCKTSSRASSHSSSSSSVSPSASASSCQCSSNNSVIERSRGVSSSSPTSCASGSSPSQDVSTSSASQSIMPTILPQKDSHSLVSSSSSRVKRNESLQCSHESNEEKPLSTHIQLIASTAVKQMSLPTTGYSLGHSSTSYHSQENTVTHEQVVHTVSSRHPMNDTHCQLSAEEETRKTSSHLNLSGSTVDKTDGFNMRKDDVEMIDSSTSRPVNGTRDSSRIVVVKGVMKKKNEAIKSDALVLGNPMTDHLQPEEEEEDDVSERKDNGSSSRHLQVAPASASVDACRRQKGSEEVRLISSSACTSLGSKSDQHLSTDESREITEQTSHHTRQNSMSSKVTGTISKYIRKTPHFKSNKLDARFAGNQSSLVKLSPLGKLRCRVRDETPVMYCHHLPRCQELPLEQCGAVEEKTNGLSLSLALPSMSPHSRATVFSCLHCKRKGQGALYT